MKPSPQRESRFVGCSFAIAVLATALCSIVVALGLLELAGIRFPYFAITYDGKSTVLFLLVLIITAKLIHACVVLWRRYRDLALDSSRPYADDD